MDIVCVAFTTSILMAFMLTFVDSGFNKASKILLTVLIVIQFYWVILFMISPRIKTTTIKTNKFNNYYFSRIVTIKKIKTYKPTSILHTHIKYIVIIPEN